MTIPQTAPCTAASIKHLYARFATTKSATYGVVKSQTELYPVNWHMNTGNPKQKLAKTTQCANSPSKHCLNAEVVQVIQITSTLGPHGSSDPPNTWHPQATARSVTQCASLGLLGLQLLKPSKIHIRCCESRTAVWWRRSVGAPAAVTLCQVLA